MPTRRRERRGARPRCPAAAALCALAIGLCSGSARAYPTSVVYANLGASGRGIAEGTSDYAMLVVWIVGLIFLAWLLPKLAERLFPQKES